MSDPVTPIVTSLEDAALAAVEPKLQTLLDNAVKRSNADPVTIAELNQFVDTGLKLGFALLNPLIVKGLALLASKLNVKVA